MQSDKGVLNLDKQTHAGSLESISRLEGDSSHFFVRGDVIGDSAFLERWLVEHQPRAILKLAAESHVDPSTEVQLCGHRPVFL